MAFRELRDFYDPDLLLPIGGTEYRFPAPTMEQAATLRERVNDVTAEEELDLIRELFGDAVQEQMRANGVKDPEAQHAGRTALAYFGISDRIGEIYWAVGDMNRLTEAVEQQQSAEPALEPVAEPTTDAPKPPKTRARKTA